MRIMLLAATLGAAALSATPARAHVELETDQAPAGSSYKAVLMVPHGCAGSPTVALRVQIPDGVVGAKPMPKPGWTVTTVVGKLANPVGTPVDPSHVRIISTTHVNTPALVAS